jgi:hypothetical protein
MTSKITTSTCRGRGFTRGGALLLVASLLSALAAPACTKSECDQGQSRCNSDGTLATCNVYANCGDSGWVCDSVWHEGSACTARLKCTQDTGDYATCVAPGTRFDCQETSLGPGARSSIAAGDFDNDGTLDLLVDQAPLRVFFGDGRGGFRSGPAGEPSGSLALRGIVTGDFDGDGRLDLAGAAFQPGANGTSTNAVVLQLGDGTGRFGPETVTAVDTSGWLAVADVDGDHRADLVWNDGVLYGAADGRLSQTRLTGDWACAASSKVVVKDFDSDGNPDVGKISPTGLCIAYGRPDRAWDAFTLALPVPTSGAMIPADIAPIKAGDAENALVLAYPSGKIELLVSSAPRIWGAPIGIAELGLADRLFTGDVDGDGHADVVVTIDNTFAVLHGTSTPAFGAPAYHAVHGHDIQVSVAAGFHGDGRLDLAVEDISGTGTSLGVSLLTHGCE